MCRLIRVSGVAKIYPVPSGSSGRVLTLGSFDGLHPGHIEVLHKVCEISKDTGLTSTLLSFYPHPSVRLKRIERMPKVTSTRQRMRILDSLKIEELALVNFSSRIAQMEWQEFCDQVLLRQFQVKHLVIGSDARIGRKALGTVELLSDYLQARRVGCSVMALKVIPHQGLGRSDKFGSRSVRSAIQNGDFNSVFALLGRRYEFSGKVIEGKKIGRTIGFPTANISNHRMVQIPNGVYAVQVFLDDHRAKFKGVMNVGVRPTVESGSNPQISNEVHLLDFAGDLYKKTIFVEVIQKIRDERKFDSLDALKVQITSDCENAQLILSGS